VLLSSILGIFLLKEDGALSFSNNVAQSMVFHFPADSM